MSPVFLILVILFSPKILAAAMPCPELAPSVLKKGEVECHDVPRGDRQADCYFKVRRYDVAKDLYRELLGSGSSARGILRLVRLSQSAARSHDLETALWANETLRRRYPGSRESREALAKIAFLYQDGARYEASVPVLRELLQKVRTPKESSAYLERLGWAFYRLKDYSRALQAFEIALKGEKTPFRLYWKARFLEKIGRKEEARVLFRSLILEYPRTYYGLRALPRVYGKRKQVLKEWWPRRGLKWEDEEYPLPYASTVFQKRRGRIDPFLIYSIMKQESQFKERVTSKAGAKGVMQLMPDTARRLAGEENNLEKLLWDPITNVELATCYLNNLLNLFGKKWYLIAAAYSAGESQVAEWRRVRKGLPEEVFIEEIPYRETREYLKNVFVNYSAYRWIYGSLP